jgi:hypothetical protein
MPFEADANGIVIKNAAGETTFDTSRSNLYIVDYKQGSATIPRGTSDTSPVNLDLGAVDSATQIIGGSWRLTNAEGLNIGQYQFVGTEAGGAFSQYLYAPRIERGHLFSIGGITVIEGFSWPFTNGTISPIVTGGPTLHTGRAYQVVQFTLESGKLRLRRNGIRIRYQQPTGAFIPSGIQFGFTFIAAAMTIEYRVFCGAFN